MGETTKLIDDYYPGKGKILDPMVGGGTVLIVSGTLLFC